MASIITFGGQPCLDPLVERDNCARLGLPVSWFGRPNSYACPLGHQTGEGWILLSRQALDALGLNTQYDLTFSLTGASQGNSPLPTATVTHQNLHIVGAKCLTPGVRSDPSAAYLVELADRRRLARARPINKAYNVRSQPGAADYFSATLNAGSAWTWATMTSDIWSAVGTDRLGTYPGLPFTPDGTPENFAFHGWYAIDALGMVLARVGCALKLDTTTDTFSIVRLQSTDTAATVALAAHDHLRVLDDEVQAPVIGRVPQYARVVFAKQRATPDDTGDSPLLVSDVADPGTALSGVDSGSYAILFDDMPAVYDSAGSNTNSAAIATRAAERAADYFRQARADRLHRTYTTPLADAAIRPGATIQATRWGDRGRGMVTEVGRFPGIVPGNPFASGMATGQSGDLFSNDTDGDTSMPSPYSPGPNVNVFNFAGPTYQTFHAWNTTVLLQFLQYYLGAAKYESYFRDVNTTDAWYFGGHPTPNIIDSASAFLEDNVRAVPYLEARGGTLDRLALHVTVAQALGKARIGIYRNTSDTVLYPGALVLDSGDIDCTTTGLKEVTVSQALPPGLYWLVFNCNDSNLSFHSIACENCWPILGQEATWGAANTRFGWEDSIAYGAMSDPFTATAGVIAGVSGAVPKLGVRYGS